MARTTYLAEEQNEKALQVLGAILAVFLIVVGGTVVYLFHVGPQLDASSKAYVDANVPLIVKTWSEDELWTRAAPEFKKAVTREELGGLFRKFSEKLGGMQRYDGSAGEANLAFLLEKGKIVTARYKAKTEFEKGPAVLNVALIQHDGQWQLLGLHVNSTVLLQ